MWKEWNREKKELNNNRWKKQRKKERKNKRGGHKSIKKDAKRMK